MRLRATLTIVVEYAVDPKDYTEGSDAVQIETAAISDDYLEFIQEAVTPDDVTVKVEAIS